MRSVLAGHRFSEWTNQWVQNMKLKQPRWELCVRVYRGDIAKVGTAETSLKEENMTAEEDSLHLPTDVFEVEMQHQVIRNTIEKHQRWWFWEHWCLFCFKKLKHRRWTIKTLMLLWDPVAQIVVHGGRWLWWGKAEIPLLREHERPQERKAVRPLLWHKTATVRRPLTSSKMNWTEKISQHTKQDKLDTSYHYLIC